MAYFPDEMPAPEPNADDAPFWSLCAERKLCFQACARCNTLRHPPRPICAKCLSVESKWVPAPAEAVVYTFTVVHHASHPAVASKLPYIVAVVEFPSLPGVRLVTNITDKPPSALCIGMHVRLWWDDIAEHIYIPRFSGGG
jgi:uncharacterized protein